MKITFHNFEQLLNMKSIITLQITLLLLFIKLYMNLSDFYVVEFQLLMKQKN